METPHAVARKESGGSDLGLRRALPGSCPTERCLGLGQRGPSGAFATREGFQSAAGTLFHEGLARSQGHAL